jgi:hypothetical protein
VIRFETRTWGELEIFYEDLSLEPADVADAAWLRAGVARVTWGRHSVVISTGPYVGRLLVPGRCVIDIAELVPGTVEALLPLAYSGVRHAEEPGVAGVAALPPWVALLNRYGELLYEYVRGGIDRRYLPRRWETTIPRGRIDLGRTVRLHRARGRPDVLSCLVRELTDDTSFHRLLVSAAVRADRILGVAPTTTGLRALRRSLIAFTGVPVEASPDVRMARAELGQHAEEQLVGLLELAELIVRGVSALPEAELDREQPASVWINVESIFEQAVRRLVDDLAAAPVRHGRGDGVTLLRGGEALEADPDVVVDDVAGVVIADAKYRRHGADVGRPELYQLMAHALAYEARRGALVTPRITGTDRNRYLGVDSLGCQYDVIVVDANSAGALRSQLRDWLYRAHVTLSAGNASGETAPSLPVPARA